MKKNVIVSLADSNYFELLNELIDSIKQFQESKGVAICILDAGLSKEQKSKLSKKVGVKRFIYASSQSIYGISNTSQELDEYESIKNLEPTIYFNQFNYLFFIIKTRNSFIINPS